MGSSKIRVRFAPSPTGGLHLGGVRTVLYNYLFARQQGGTFVLRIEDTDQSRFVSGAEDYIYECLKWCGINPDESPVAGGDFGPYRQSERKHLYRSYAEKLIREGYAYYAFDTPEELEAMRVKYKTESNPSPQYDRRVREKMKNSLSLPPEEVKQLIDEGYPHVVRIKMPVDEELRFTDMIRGEVSFNTSLVDDKVLLKGDGMPTYHLAVVVDDYLMKITHAFRGEEWLPSAPVHILLWKYLGWENQMPQWAHLPLILRPDGHGKLSKRDGDLLGFPVFAMNWTDPNTNELIRGFREMGFLPQAFINMLALLGWNSGSEQEIFSMEELINFFSIERVHKGGARFDFEKAKWFNHEWIKKLPASSLLGEVKEFLEPGLKKDDTFLEKAIALAKDRCTLLTDFKQQTEFFYKSPASYDLAAIQSKWNSDKKDFFHQFQQSTKPLAEWNPENIEALFKELIQSASLKPGELLLPFRIMLVGGKYGPPVFEIAALIGKEETINRINSALEVF